MSVADLKRLVARTPSRRSSWAWRSASYSRRVSAVHGARDSLPHLFEQMRQIVEVYASPQAQGSA